MIQDRVGLRSKLNTGSIRAERIRCVSRASVTSPTVLKIVSRCNSNPMQTQSPWQRENKK